MESTTILKVFGFVAGAPLAVWTVVDDFTFWRLVPLVAFVVIYVGLVARELAKSADRPGHIQNRIVAASVLVTLAAFVFPLVGAWNREGNAADMERKLGRLAAYDDREPLLQEARWMIGHLHVAQSVSGYYANFFQLKAVQSHLEGNLAVLLEGGKLVARIEENFTYIKTGPNAFRVTFKPLKEHAPRIEIEDLPSGVTANITELSPAGFVVTFSPVSIPVEKFTVTTRLRS